jgi:hypothetical protein
MTEHTLHEFLMRRGYTLVCSIGKYSAFHAQDIVEERVRPGACPTMEVSTYILDELTETQLTIFFEQCLRHAALVQGNEGIAPTPFDTNKWYQVVMTPKPLSEWKGWSLDDLRRIFGMNKKEEQ